GNFTLMLMATDSVGATSAPGIFTITINPALSITTTSLPNGEPNVPYSQTITISGGTGAIMFALQSGSSLPPGLNLNPTTGVISGTPTSVGVTNFTIVATDSIGGTASAPLSINIDPGEADPAKSTVSAVPTSFTAGGSTTITLQAKDSSGNNLTTG